MINCWLQNYPWEPFYIITSIFIIIQGFNLTISFDMRTRKYQLVYFAIWQKKAVPWLINGLSFIVCVGTSPVHPMCGTSHPVFSSSLFLCFLQGDPLPAPFFDLIDGQQGWFNFLIRFCFRKMTQSTKGISACKASVCSTSTHEVQVISLFFHIFYLSFVSR